MGRGRHQLAKTLLGHQLRQRHAGRPEPVLQDDAELGACGLDRINQRLGAFKRDLHGLFQEHMLAGPRGALRELEMRIGRRQNHDRVDRAVSEDRVDVAGHRKTPALGEGGAPCFGRAVGGRDLDPVLADRAGFARVAQRPCRAR